MKRHEQCNDYRNFSDPWYGLATMILVQAVQDYKALTGFRERRLGQNVVNRSEIVNFFRSEWASKLAEALGVEDELLDRFRDLEEV